MSRHVRLLAAYAAALLTSALVAPAAGEISQRQNVSFTAGGLNPWAEGAALEIGPKTYSLICSPGTSDCAFEVPPFRVNLPPVNASLEGVVTDLLEQFLDVSFPSLASLKLRGTAQVNNLAVEFGYFASAGRLNINYPAQSRLTFAPGDLVLANQQYSIDSQFTPGVYNLFGNPTTYDIGAPILIPTAGNGYGENDLGVWTASRYNAPKFATTAPNAEAWLYAGGDARIGATLEASALAGAIEANTQISVGGPFGGRLVEVDNSGLYVNGKPIVEFNLTEPHTFGIPGGSGTIQFPRLDNNGQQTAPGSSVLHGRHEQPVLTITGDLEKIIPLVGPFLHNSFGDFFEYDLAQIGAGPEIRLYQDMTFTPNPKVRLTFSEPVLIDGSDVPTLIAEFPLNQQKGWRPLFSNSNQITVVPEYILDNTFKNVTGIQIGVQVEVDALSITAPFIPNEDNTVGPLYNPDPFFFSLGDIPLFSPEFPVNLPSIVGGAIVIPKANIDIVTGFGDLKLDSWIFVEPDPANPGYVVTNLNFSRTVDGEPLRQYSATVSTVDENVFPFPEGGEDDFAKVLASLGDVVVTDPVTSEQFNLGRKFCIYGCDLSAFLPAVSPEFVVADPDNPGQFLPNIYLPYLAEIPDTDVDVVSHPYLGVNNTLDSANLIDGLEKLKDPATLLDRREQATTTILARTSEFVPDGIEKFGSFNAISMNENGDVAFHSALNFVNNTSGFYFADESGKVNYLRSGDPAPGGGGTLQIFNTNSVQVNSLGQTAFVLGISGSFSNSIVLRGDSEGLELIAREGQTAPDGNGTFQDFGGAYLNDVGQVLFWTRITHPVLGTDEVIYVSDGTTLAEVARQGDVAPGMPGLMDSFGYLSLNNSGQVAFDVYTTGNAQGLYVKDTNGLTLIAGDGGGAPGGGEFAGINDQDLNDVGQVAFAAGIREFPGGPLTFGIFRGDGNSLVQIAREGQLAPDGDGTLKNNLFNFQLNDLGQVVFDDRVDAATEYEAIFLGDGGALLQIAREGQLAPNGNGQFIRFPGSQQLNNHGHVAFAAAVSNTPGNDEETGIYLYDGTSLVEVVRPGQPLAGSTLANADGAVINDDMQVAYRANLSDGRVVIARFEPHLYWRNASSGDWDTDSNWSLGFAPRSPYDVFIIAENAFTVAGPIFDRTVKSLTIGGENTAEATLDLPTGVTLTATNGTTIRPNGVVTGFGTLAGTVTNGGTISPGNSPGLLHIEGDYTQTSTGTLRIEIASATSYDQLLVSGDVMLGGALSVVLLDGFLPNEGQSFSLFGEQFGAITGAFESIEFPTFNGLTFSVIQTVDSIALQVVPSVGDFNHDGSVDAADYVLWRKNPGGNYTQQDYDNWRENFGRTAGSGTALASTAAVPEPQSLLLLGMTLVAALSAPRRWVAAKKRG